MFNLYHTKRSIKGELEKSDEISFRTRLLQDAIKSGSLDELALTDLSPADCDHLEATITELVAKVIERRRKLDVHSIRYKVAREVLLLKGMVALPILPFLDEAHELFNPNVTLAGCGVELTLEKILTQIRAYRIYTETVQAFA